MVVDQDPAPNVENVDMPANSAKVIKINSVAVETEAVNVGGKMIDPLAKNVEIMLTGAPGPPSSLLW